MCHLVIAPEFQKVTETCKMEEMKFEMSFEDRDMMYVKLYKLLTLSTLCFHCFSQVCPTSPYKMQKKKKKKKTKKNKKTQKQKTKISQKVIY